VIIGGERKARFGGPTRTPHCTRLSIWCAVIARHEVLERIGLGRSSRRGRVFGRAQPLACLVHARGQTGGARRREPAGPWPVRPRLVKGQTYRMELRLQPMLRTLLLVPQGKSGDGVERPAASPGSSDWHGGWLQPHPEVSSQPSASWVRRVDEGDGDRSIAWLCSWTVLVAEVDERHLVQAAPTTGNRRGKRWV
jgi:hypothetical protein